jgi:serine O-acetyltransferase
MNKEFYWQIFFETAKKIYKTETFIQKYIYESVLKHRDIDELITENIITFMSDSHITHNKIFEIVKLNLNSNIKYAFLLDNDAYTERDPACLHHLHPFLFYKGFQALQCYRIAHELWNKNSKNTALLIQKIIIDKFGIDIHPAAKIGQGIMLDHSSSIVIGETAQIGDNVSILHEVTLGGNGKDKIDRHPKIGDNVLIGAGAKILGNIKVGNNSKIASGSVVLNDVDENVTVAGIPAKVVSNHNKTKCISKEMNHKFN